MTVVLTRSPLDGLVAANRRADVEAVLRAALPQAPVTAARALTGGASGAVMLRIEAGGSPYVLRLDAPPDGLRDPARHYACQAIAAGAGLAPALLHGDAPRRISLSAFVVDAAAAMTRPQRLAAVARSVRRLHDGPAFPRLLPYLDAMSMVVGHFAAARLVPSVLSEEVASRFAALSAAYPCIEADIVASHCDLNPGNILYAGGRAVFVDWESAFAADRYVDIAAVLNYLAIDEVDETLILHAYFDRTPTEHERARVIAMRQVNRLFYATLLLVAAAGQGVRATTDDLSGPGYAALRQGPISVVGGAGKVALGCAFLSDALAALRDPSFEDALAVLK